MIRSIALAASVLMLASVATAFDGDRQKSSKGFQASITWSTRDHDGNRFGIVFDFNDRGFGVHASYTQDRFGRYRPYSRYDRRHFPPVYDYDRYGRGRYDTKHFYSYDEWNDWHEWLHHWDDGHNWYYNDHARDHAWKAFLDARSHAQFEHDRRHRLDRHSRRFINDFKRGPFLRRHNDDDDDHDKRRRQRRKHDDDDDDDDDDHDKKRRRKGKGH